MRTIRRVGGTALAGLLLTAVVGGPAASAQTETKNPETYVGTAAGRALNLKIGGQGITAGFSAVNVDSTLKAVAESAGALNVPVIGGNNAGKVEVAGDGTRQAKLDQCATPSISAIPGVGAQLSTVLTAGAACSSSLAEVVNGAPHALATGTVFDLDVKANTVLSQVPLGALAPVVNQVYGGIDQLNKALQPVLGTDLKVDDTLAEVVTKLQTTKTLDVRLGGSRSENLVEGTKVTSVAKSEAGVIALFPLGDALPVETGVTLKPLVEIVIGSASASATYDRATGKSEPKFDPAIVTIRVNTPTTDAVSQRITGFTPQEIKIAPNLSASGLPIPAQLSAIVQACPDAPNEFCILTGTPLETRIAVASGRTVTNADGSVGAIADAVKIHALRNIGTVAAPLAGGILLELAHAEAGVGGRPAELITISAPEIPRELPRTGGTPVLPMVAVAGLGIALAARRTIARATAR
ncbi:MAG TPA: hypothetical protein VM345_05300 [Acidimicrobiales bacterium]|jgi:hypothetical protein|nr:hypothetical protein [Acidimicrobiales bacterium]